MARLFGNDDDNRLTGTNVADLIYGRSGDDALYGFRGNDTIDGGEGNDRIWASEGANRVSGGSGNDRIWAGAGSDVIDIHPPGQVVDLVLDADGPQADEIAVLLDAVLAEITESVRMIWDDMVDTMEAMPGVGLAAPLRDPARLMRLLCDRIPTIDPGFGIEIMSLTATLAEPLVPRQTDSLLEPAAPDMSSLIDSLTNRVGARAVYRLAPVASDVPERSVTRVAPMSVIAEGWPDHWPRPSRLLARPEPIDTMALLPDHPPRWIVWRGARHDVEGADGPERIFGEWWKRDAETRAVRDYFRIEDQAGRRFWIFRQGDGEDVTTGSHNWFLHGVFG